MSIPKVSQIPSGYLFEWVEEKLKIEVSHIHQHRDGRVGAELLVKTAASEHLHRCQVSNLLSSRLKSEFSKTMNDTRFNAEWAVIIEQLAELALNQIREGEPAKFITTSQEIKPVEYLIYPLIPQKYGTEPDMELLIGCIDEDGTPRLVEVYSDGDYGHVDGYSAIGSGSIFGEFLLRKLYNPNMTIKVAERLIAYIIWEVQAIDNDSGEDMQLICISKDKALYETSHLEIEAYKQLPRLIHKFYQNLESEIQSIELEPIKFAIAELDKLVTES